MSEDRTREDGMLKDKTMLDCKSASVPCLLRERRGRVELITLNRPQSRNSLSAGMIEELSDSLKSIAGDDQVRAVVLAAAGPAFCAGHDLKELTVRRADADGGRAFFENLMSSCQEMMQAIVDLPQPVIAAAHGIATAAGCQLVASCDLAVAAETAGFATPGVNIGLFCSTPMVALSRNLSPKHAMEMLLTGELITADEAYRMGLVNRVVAPGSELDEALALAQRIAEKSWQAVRFGKRAFYEQKEMSLSDAYAYASKIMVDNLLAADADEGICAFIEKRAPQWRDV